MKRIQLLFFCIWTFILALGIFITNSPIFIAQMYRGGILYATDEDNARFVGVIMIFSAVSANIYYYLQGSHPILKVFQWYVSLLNKKKIYLGTEVEINEGLSDENKVEEKESLQEEENKTVTLTGRDRLLNEIEKTRKNSNINLGIGIFTTAVAVYILGITVFSVEDIKFPRQIHYYIPRVTLTLFVELFSFFFLRLYRKNLDDIKYLTNEITTIEAKMQALEFIKNESDNSIKKTVIEEIVKTERNFILKKGQSTIEIEKLKIESASQSEIVQTVLKSVNGVIGSKN